jgi:hypothetical protein
MARWGFLKRRTTALWLALIVGGFTALFALNASSSDLRNEVMAEIKNATERGEVSVDVSEVVKEAIRENTDQGVADLLARNGFEEQLVARFDDQLLQKYGADRYRVFSGVVHRINWYSYWHGRVILIYKNDTLINSTAMIGIVGM